MGLVRLGVRVSHRRRVRGVRWRGHVLVPPVVVPMRDRLDTFVHALYHYCMCNQPADLLSAIEYAKNELENQDAEDIQLEDDVIDSLGPQP